MSTSVTLDSKVNLHIHPISDLRTHLPQIEKETREGAEVVMNRNGKPVLLVQDYDTVMKEREIEVHRQKIREAEIWDRASGGKRYSYEEVLNSLKADLAEFKTYGLGSNDE